MYLLMMQRVSFGKTLKFWISFRCVTIERRRELLEVPLLFSGHSDKLLPKDVIQQGILKIHRHSMFNVPVMLTRLYAPSFVTTRLTK
jgi:hypothetical protein